MTRFLPRSLAPQHASAAAVSRKGPDLLNLAVSGVIFTFVWRVQDLFPVLAEIKGPSLASLAALAIWLFNRDPKRKLRTIRHPVTTLVCVIMGLAVLSVPNSLYPGLSFAFINDDLSKNFLLFVLLAASVRAFADVRRYASTMLIGGTIYAFYVYLFVPVGRSGRLGDIVYYDANDLGMLLLCVIPIALFFVIRGRQLAFRMLSLGSMALLLLVIIKTGSRGAFLGLIGVAIYMLFLFRGVSAKSRWVAVGAGVIAVMSLGGPKYWKLMGTLLHPEDDYNWSGGADEGRVEIWKRGMGYMISHPITGVGVSAFPVAEGQISPLAERQELGIGVKWSAAHNSFVQIGAELGVPGLVAFLLVLFQGFRAARNAGQRVGATRVGRFMVPAPPPSDEEVLGQAFAASLVGYVFAGFFLSQAYGAFTFAILAMIVGVSKVRQASVSAHSGSGAAQLTPSPLAGSARVRRAGVVWPRAS